MNFPSDAIRPVFGRRKDWNAPRGRTDAGKKKNCRKIMTKE
jgi:hypothetical protein